MAQALLGLQKVVPTCSIVVGMCAFVTLNSETYCATSSGLI